MLARYREVVEIVLHFRESKEKQIQRAVISLIPRLAAFAPERFAATYLDTCVDYLISIVKCAQLTTAVFWGCCCALHSIARMHVSLMTINSTSSDIQ